MLTILVYYWCFKWRNWCVKYSYLQHELAVIPANKDHFSGESVASPPAAHQEPGGHAHFCNLLRPLVYTYLDEKQVSIWLANQSCHLAGPQCSKTALKDYIFEWNCDSSTFIINHYINIYINSPSLKHLLEQF